ncbi:MAG TPA: hypothetical protein VFA41_03870 [Ktedonobacteraceae bacterium]|nr:hypothetical protein [Ktedonobacteraceae bacterium]
MPRPQLLRCAQDDRRAAKDGRRAAKDGRRAAKDGRRAAKDDRRAGLFHSMLIDNWKILVIPLVFNSRGN